MTEYLEIMAIAEYIDVNKDTPEAQEITEKEELDPRKELSEYHVLQNIALLKIIPKKIKKRLLPENENQKKLRYNKLVNYET